jgi:preprotein translocase subunit SecD
MKLTWKIWVFVFALAFAAMSILNIPISYNILVGVLIISILATLSFVKEKSTRTFLLILTGAAILAIIFFTAQQGVAISSVTADSTAFNEGLKKGMIITAINGNLVKNTEDYSTQITSLFYVEENSLDINKSKERIKLEIKTTTGNFIFLTNETPEISVSNIPKTNLKTGLDLSGGARAMIRPENVTLSSNEMEDLIAVTSNRLNTFGISDVNVRSVSDLAGNTFVLVEVAGLTTDELRELVGKQGKFEAKIGNSTVFIGGEKDIASVCRTDATCAGIRECLPSSDGSYVCRFTFTIYLSQLAAERHAIITGNLSVNSTDENGTLFAGGEKYLSERLNLLVDDKLVDTLLISEGLKGSSTTQISISGSGTGATQEDAYNSAQANMKKLQTILITGSLPYKLEIVKLDSASPVLGKEFTKNILYLGLIVFAIVSTLLFIKYRKIKITLAVILTMFSEALITLGIAALIKWNLDAPSIAGIIAGMGTGVNDQIVIIDEAVSEEQENLKEKIKRAFFIIIGAFFTIIAAMLPLFWAGAGLLRGFALTTIIGVSVGILITRPAFGDIIKKIQE